MEVTYIAEAEVMQNLIISAIHPLPFYVNIWYPLSNATCLKNEDSLKRCCSVVSSFKLRKCIFEAQQRKLANNDNNINKSLFQQKAMYKKETFLITEIKVFLTSHTQ